MRYLVTFCFLLCLCVFASCAKKDITKPADISGTWELRAYYNGWTGQSTIVTDSIRQITFTNTTYQNFTDGVLQSSGTYDVIRDTSFMSGETGDRIVYDNNTNDLRTFIKLSHDSLTFSPDAYDAGGSLYIRR